MYGIRVQGVEKKKIKKTAERSETDAPFSCKRLSNGKF